MRYLFSIVFILSALAAGSACAEYPLHAFRENKEEFLSDTKQRSYLIGLGRGIVNMNAALEVTKGQKLYCAPDRLSYDGGVIISIIINYLDRTELPETTSIEALAVLAFMETFPCTK